MNDSVLKHNRRAWCQQLKLENGPMADKPDIKQHVREICLSIPKTIETESWGKPNLRVKLIALFGQFGFGSSAIRCVLHCNKVGNKSHVTAAIC